MGDQWDMKVSRMVRNIESTDVVQAHKFNGGISDSI
jgi:hypothetical protein